MQLGMLSVRGDHVTSVARTRYAIELQPTVECPPPTPTPTLCPTPTPPNPSPWRHRHRHSPSMCAYPFVRIVQPWATPFYVHICRQFQELFQWQLSSFPRNGRCNGGFPIWMNFTFNTYCYKINKCWPSYISSNLEILYWLSTFISFHTFIYWKTF